MSKLYDRVSKGLTDHKAVILYDDRNVNRPVYYSNIDITVYETGARSCAIRGNEKKLLKMARNIDEELEKWEAI